jgi:hypothetical protein
MMTDADKPHPVVEAVPNGRPAEQSGSQLRIRQQEILAELGVLALQGTPFRELLDKTASLTAEGLEAEFCKVLEYQRQEARFLVTAGVGWGPDVIGAATVGADIESPAGYALITGKPVISNHLEIEERFRTPELLVRHGIRRAMNVILQGDGSPFGVLEVDRPLGRRIFNQRHFLFARCGQPFRDGNRASAHRGKFTGGGRTQSASTERGESPRQQQPGFGGQHASFEIRDGK